jgi:hypothetical protein
LDANVYYAEIFEEFCSVVREPDKGDAFSIAIVQEIFVDADELKVLKTDLAYVHANFTSLSQPISEFIMVTVFF